MEIEVKFIDHEVLKLPPHTAKIEPRIGVVRRKDLSISLALCVCVARAFFYVNTEIAL